jgi:two-component system LytT family response regulator
MSEISCIIVEDEPLAVQVLRDYVEQVPFLQLKGCFKDAITATAFLREHEVDLIFLDIHLPRLKGMDFLRTLNNPPAVIVTTAYHQYAIEGFELNVTDYLLKPIEFARFLVAVNKVKSAANEETAEPSSPRTHLFLNVQKKKVKILFDDILFVESQREYVKIVTSKKEWLTKMSTSELEELLPPQQFRRIHRSFIIALNKIDSYTAEEVEINGVSIPVGRGYRDALEGL